MMTAAKARPTKTAYHHGDLRTALESDASARKRQKSKMDTNRDGKISITEFANFLPRVWQDADGNNDNRISAAELKAARSALQ
jgi:hypothetical protein